MLVHRQMEPLALPAGAAHRGPHVAHPERVDDAGAPGRLDLAPHGGQPRARLARGHDVAQAERARIDLELPRAGGQVGGERERAEDRGDSEPRDQLEQPSRLARADRHHGRPARLERHVVGDAAGVERVVEAVGDHVGRLEASDPERLAADGAVRLVVGPGEADRHRVAGRAGGHVHAHEPLGCGAQLRAEGWIGALARAQLLLRGEREPRQVRGAPYVLADPAQPRRVERARRLEVGELLLEGGHPRAGSSSVAASSRAAATVRP